MTNEDDEEIKITFQNYKEFFGKQYQGGYKYIINSQLAMIIFSVCKMGGDYIIGQWAESTD